MAKNNRQKKKRSKNRQISPSHPGSFGKRDEQSSNLQYFSFDITDEPIEDDSMPEKLSNEMNELHEIIFRTPALAIERLETLIAKYPTIPRLYNFIATAYSRMGNEKKARYYVEENYRNNPDYLFAKLNYAQTCMAAGDYEKIPEILDHKFVIKALYPQREKFHITEVVSFLGIVGLYFAYMNNRDQVKIHYDMLRQLAPGHIFTKQLKRYLFFSSIKSYVKKLMDRSNR
jgi:tetratricopeptide (TPR) repeat protein